MLAVPPVAAKSYPSIPLPAIVMRCFGAGLLAWLSSVRATGGNWKVPSRARLCQALPLKGLGWALAIKRQCGSAKMPLCHPWIPARLRWRGRHSTSRKRIRSNPRLFWPCCQALSPRRAGGRPWEWVGVLGTQSGEYIWKTPVEQNGSARRPTGAERRGDRERRGAATDQDCYNAKA